MISKLSHVTFFVLDVHSAKAFYTDKLGFEIKMNIPVGENGLWLTVSPPGQDIEITLIPVSNELMFKKDTSEKLAELIKAKAFGFGVFECSDVYATYEELKGKGVEFIKIPSEGGGTPEAIFSDDSGNFFGLCKTREPKPTTKKKK
jgi:catechol 2,3-dioxygenase-like lactoylglutathione lyase family enzyme